MKKKSYTTNVNNKKFIDRKILEKIIYSLAIVCALFLFSTSMVYGLLSIDNINIPGSIHEGDTLYVSFIASTDTGNDLAYSVYQNGLLISSEESYSMHINYSMQGIHTFNFTVTDGVDTISEYRSLDILDVPMVINILNPLAHIYNNKTLLVSVSTSMVADTCTYNTNTSLSGTLIGSGQSFSSLVTFTNDGSYLLNVNCTNSYESKYSSVNFVIDTINPVILAKSSTVNNDGSVEFTVTTDKLSVCKYGVSNLDFDSMPYTFSNTNNLIHHTLVSGLMDGSYTYYIKCKSSTNNNFANTETLSFNIIIKPKASIDIESVGSEAPLKSGTYVVKLTSSEPLASAPSLYYNFNTDATQRFITLTGSGTTWSGYMIINSDVPNMIGTFYYSGVDLTNNIGTQIISGQLFLIDTTAPVAPISVEAESQSNGNIELRWYYDGEDVKRYNIYRSVSGDPQYVDYIDSSSSKKYIDEDTVEGVDYYYRVAAVDDAGNDGYLSEVMKATSIILKSQNYPSVQSGDVNGKLSYSDSKIPFSSEGFLDISLVPKVDQLISDLEEHLLDISIAKKELDSINDPTKLNVINLMDLSEKISTAKNSIDSTISQVKGLKNQRLSSSELDMKLNKFRMDGIKYKSMVPEDILIDEQSSFNQITLSADVENAISELVDQNLSRKILNDYISKNKQLQDNIIVNTDVIIFKIKYLGKDDYDRYTLVKKTLSSSIDLKDVTLVETIPKSFESDAKNIYFNIKDQKDPFIVNSDPVVRWDFEEFKSEIIYYMINSHAELSSAKESKAIVLITPNFNLSQTISDDSNNGLTGFVGLELGSIDFKPIHLIVLIGVLSIIGLSLYYVSLDRKEKQLLSGNGSSKNNAVDTNTVSNTNSDAYPANNSNTVALSNNLSSHSNNHSNTKSRYNSATNSNNNQEYTSNDRAYNYNNFDNYSVNSNTSNINKNTSPSKPNASFYVNSNNIDLVDSNDLSDEVHSSKKDHASKSNNLSNNLKKLNPESHLDFNDMSRRLDAANLLINSFDYEKSRQIYNSCIEFYKKYHFKSIKEKSDFKLMLDHLYVKLLAYRLVHVSRKSSKDSMQQNVVILDSICLKLYHSITNVSEEYRADEKKFIDYVYNSASHLKKMAS